MKKILKWGAIVFLILIVIGALSGGSNNKPSVNNTTTPTESIKKLNYTYDIPSLVGKSQDEVKTSLSSYQQKTGNPTDEQIRLGIKEWEVAFTKDGKDLLVTYDIKTNKIKDFFISTDDPSGKTKDKSYLLAIGNLEEHSTRYSVEFVPTLKDPSYFTGVKIIPAR